MRRRDLLRLGGVVAVIIAAQNWVRSRPPDLAFEPMRGLPGFRRLALGPVSGSVDPLFTGLDRPDPIQLALQDEARADPCRAAFGQGTDTRLPVAVFTDYFCPFCPEMSETAITVASGDPGVRLVWHDYPVFGPRSTDAARMALAAGRQGAYLPVHRYLMHARIPPGRAGLAILADRFALDAAQLERDAGSAETTRSLARSQAIASVLGIPGTPSLLIGRTLTIGRLSARELHRLIELERERGVPETCPG